VDKSLPPPLMAAKSIKLVLQLVLKQDWQEAENRKADKETNTGGSDGVHRAAHLLESGACLNEYKGRRCNPNEGADPEWQEGNPDHRGDDVDEPVGKERRDPQKDYVGEQVAALCFHLAAPLSSPLWQVMSDEAPAHQVGEQVAEGGAGGRAEAHRRQGEREGEEEPGDDGEEDAAGDGEGLEENISAKEASENLCVVLLLVARQYLTQEFGVLQGARELQVFLILRTDFGQGPPHCEHCRGGGEENEKDEKNCSSCSQLPITDNSLSSGFRGLPLLLLTCNHIFTGLSIFISSFMFSFTPLLSSFSSL